ncbi:putative cytochrome P450 [Amniculicola lignicola CBS 123094]|uniref:Putative cytochrome P450 n=1 Tax=Amniculicola lignicola CBS 123094 TaxID=1392246 RepID=A0A6A5VVR8_9PLEO|nr:putative cytochrome P450 [Amniculicola lignicola CBS 123094]
MQLAFALTVATCIIIAIWHKFWARKHGDRRPEPPVIPTYIPIFGHAFGMIWYKKEYYKQLRDKCHLPIVTLPLPGSKIYAAFSVPIIQAIQKHSKTLAFQPIQAKFSVKLCGASKDALRILKKDMDPENGTYGNIYVSMHKALNPGETLNELNRAMISRVCDFVDTIQRPPAESINVNLAEWLRHHLTAATTDAVYGPHNPFRDQAVEKAFWIFEREIPKLIFLPDWLALRGARNRKVVADAFKRYFLSGHHDQASGLVKDFYASEIEYGFSMSDRSLFEVGHALAVLGNTSSAVFWLVFYVFSSPEALQEIRQEVSTIMTTSINEASGKKEYIVDLRKVNASCPTLVSCFREAIRLHSIGISLRQVCKDTVLNDTYRLDKDAMVLMPTIAIHTDPALWGDDVNSFNYRRFHHSNPRKIPPAAFRSFGGGTTLCPGRHFATTQIMAWTTMLVMRFDVEPATGGPWVQPTTENANLANVMAMPDNDIEVKITSREECQNGTWRVIASDKEAMFSITAEDLEEKK